MPGDAPPSEPGNEQPRKNVLDLSALIAPPVSVETAIGNVFLYPLRVSDITHFSQLSSKSPSTRIREFLPNIASLVEASPVKDYREPLKGSHVARLSDDEIEVIAEAYIASSSLKEARSGSKDRDALARDDPEQPTSYLDRLLRKEVEAQSARMKRMREHLQASASGIFDQVRKSSSELSATLSSFDIISRSATERSNIDTGLFEMSNQLAEEYARRARDRAEELEMVRLTGQMTAQSATTLLDLAEAAAAMLERIDKRDQQSDADTRKSLRIAVWSVAISAALALFALLVSGASYVQDKTNNSSGDVWQDSLLSAIKAGNQQREELSAENKRLEAKVNELSQLVRARAPKASATPGR